MFPHERSLVKQLAGTPFALIGVNSDSDITVPQQLTADGTVTWRSFWNGPEGTGGPISTKWGIQGWPTIFLIDQDGVIRHKGFITGNQLDQALEEMLAAAGHEVKIVHDEEGEGEGSSEADGS